MIINLKSQTDLSSFYIVYNGSTLLEEKGEKGISHFMEHLLCQNLDKYQDEFQIDGINQNAYTSTNNVVFYIQGLDEKVNKWKNKFLESVSEFEIKKERFENERKIVIEEYKDSFNDQTQNHYLNLDRKIYGNYNPIGKLEDIQNCTYLDCINFYEKQFLNPTKIINVSKNYEFDSNINFANENVDKIFDKNDGSNDFEEYKYDRKSSIILKSDILKEDHNIAKVVCKLFAEGLNSPLYQEIREKRGLVYFISLFTDRMNLNSDINFMTLTSDENVEKVLDCVKDVFDNYKKYVTRDRFNNIKEAIRVALKMNEIDRYQNINRWVNPPSHNVTEIIDKITLEDCYNVIEKYFNWDNFYVSIDKKEFGF